MSALLEGEAGMTALLGYAGGYGGGADGYEGDIIEQFFGSAEAFDVGENGADAGGRVEIGLFFHGADEIFDAKLFAILGFGLDQAIGVEQDGGAGLEDEGLGAIILIGIDAEDQLGLRAAIEWKWRPLSVVPLPLPLEDSISGVGWPAVAISTVLSLRSSTITSMVTNWPWKPWTQSCLLTSRRQRAGSW